MDRFDVDLNAVVRTFWPHRVLDVRVSQDFVLEVFVIKLTDVPTLRTSAAWVSRYELAEFRSRAEMLDHVVRMVLRCGESLELEPPAVSVLVPSNTIRVQVAADTTAFEAALTRAETAIAQTAAAPTPPARRLITVRKP